MSGDAEPDEYYVQEALAEAAYAAGDWVGYRRHLESVGAWPPNQSASLHEMRAIATGDEAAMRSMLERNAERGSIDAVMQLARDAYRAGDVDEAQRLLERAARFDDPWMILIFGCVASDGGDAAGARWHFERSAALGDEDGAYELALLDRDEGDEPAAVLRLQGLAEGGHADAACALAEILRIQGDEAGASRWLVQAIDAGHAGAILIRYAREKEHRQAHALALWRRVEHSLDLDDLGGRLSAGMVMGQKAYAEDALWMMSGSLAAAGEEDGARRMRAAARTAYEARIRRNAEDDEALLNLGLLLDEDGEAKAAYDHLVRSAALGHPEAMEKLAELAEEAGDAEEARRWRELAGAGEHA